jgi:Spy/CpxP family protein refolding chaperone
MPDHVRHDGKGALIMEVEEMKKLIIAVGFLAATFLAAGYALAQGSGHDSGHGSAHQPASVQQHGASQQQAGSHEHRQEGAPGKDFSLTPEQKVRLQELRRKFKLENAQLIGSLVGKRIELCALWSDPKSDSKVLMEKEKELSSILFQLREKKIQAKLEARTFLTPEQMRHFKHHWGMGFKKKMHHGGMMGHGQMRGHRGMMGRGEGAGAGHGGMMCRCPMGSGHGKEHGAEHGTGAGMGRGMGHGMGR